MVNEISNCILEHLLPYSGRRQIQLIRGGGGGSDLTTQPKLANFYPTMDFYVKVTQNLISSNFYLAHYIEKITFGPLSYDQPIYFMLYFENRTFRHSKVVQKLFFRHCDEYKSC